MDEKLSLKDLVDRARTTQKEKDYIKAVRALLRHNSKSLIRTVAEDASWQWTYTTRELVRQWAERGLAIEEEQRDFYFYFLMDIGVSAGTVLFLFERYPAVNWKLISRLTERASSVERRKIFTVFGETAEKLLGVYDAKKERSGVSLLHDMVNAASGEDWKLVADTIVGLAHRIPASVFMHFITSCDDFAALNEFADDMLEKCRNEMRNKEVHSGRIVVMVDAAALTLKQLNRLADKAKLEHEFKERFGFVPKFVQEEAKKVEPLENTSIASKSRTVEAALKQGWEIYHEFGKQVILHRVRKGKKETLTLYQRETNTQAP